VSAMSRVGLQYHAEDSQRAIGHLLGSQEQRPGGDRQRGNEEAEMALRK
jgi:hypothetical protein